jgi:hypothetical protein
LKNLVGLGIDPGRLPAGMPVYFFGMFIPYCVTTKAFEMPKMILSEKKLISLLDRRSGWPWGVRVGGRPVYKKNRLLQ